MMFRACIMVLDSCIRRVLPCVLRWIAVSFNIWTQINFLLKWMLNYVHIYSNIATWTNELNWHLNGIGGHHHFPWCMISDKQFFQRLIQKIKDNKCKWIKWLNEFKSNIYLDILELMAIGGLHRSMVWEWMWFNDDDDHQWECVCVCEIASLCWPIVSSIRTILYSKLGARHIALVWSSLGFPPDALTLFRLMTIVPFIKFGSERAERENERTTDWETQC